MGKMLRNHLRLSMITHENLFETFYKENSNMEKDKRIELKEAKIQMGKKSKT